MATVPASASMNRRSSVDQSMPSEFDHGMHVGASGLCIWDSLFRNTNQFLSLLVDHLNHLVAEGKLSEARAEEIR